MSEQVKIYRSKFIGQLTPRTECNFRSVTVKQLKEAFQGRRFEGRFLLDNSQLYTVSICGQLIHIDQSEKNTDYVVFDGTGSVEGRLWPCLPDGDTDLSGAVLNDYYMIICNILDNGGKILLRTLTARKVKDYNEVTVHMLTVIHQHCMLQALERNDVEKWQKAKSEADRAMKSTLALELDKEAIIDLLSQEQVRQDPAGATVAYIMGNLQMTAAEAWGALKHMLDEGSLYNTTDYEHFKLADDG